MEGRRNMSEWIITRFTCLRLLSATWRENKRFHWALPTVTNTHFNRLQIFGQTSLAAHFSESDFYLFDLCAAILNVVEMFRFFWRLTDQTQGRRKDCNFSPLRVMSLCTVHVLALPPPASSGSKLEETHKRDCRDQTQHRAASFKLSKVTPRTNLACIFESC